MQKLPGLVSLAVSGKLELLQRSSFLTSLETKEKKAEKTVSSTQRSAKLGGWTLLGKKKSTARKGKGSKGMSGSHLPPQLETVTNARFVLRFRVAGGVGSPGYSITGNNLATACGGMCTLANTTLVPVFSSGRLHSIKIWPAGQSVGANINPVEVIWFSPIAAITRDTSKEVCIPSGTTVPSVVVAKPPRNTFCADWMNFSSVGSTVVFRIDGLDIGTVVDVAITATLTNNFGPNSAVISTGTLGGFYYLALDGRTTNGIRPVGKPTTT